MKKIKELFVSNLSENKNAKLELRSIGEGCEFNALALSHVINNFDSKILHIMFTHTNRKTRHNLSSVQCDTMSMLQLTIAKEVVWEDDTIKYIIRDEYKQRMTRDSNTLLAIRSTALNIMRDLNIVLNADFDSIMPKIPDDKDATTKGTVDSVFCNSSVVKLFDYTVPIRRAIKDTWHKDPEYYSILHNACMYLNNVTINPSIHRLEDKNNNSGDENQHTTKVEYDPSVVWEYMGPKWNALFNPNDVH